mgnify:CR=1 FL=1
MDSNKQMEVSRHLSHLLVLSADLSKTVFAEIASSFDVPVHLARAVLLLEEPAPMSDLSQKLACDKSYITQLADQLEELELIERVPGADRRTKLLALTTKGRGLRTKLAKAAGSQSPIMRSLNDEERAQLESLLAKIVS